MNFKAAMMLLSWRELMVWMQNRGREAAVILFKRVEDLSDDEDPEEVVWDRTFPTDEEGLIEVRVQAYYMGSTWSGDTSREFDFKIPEDKWFSYEPLKAEDFT